MCSTCFLNMRVMGGPNVGGWGWVGEDCIPGNQSLQLPSPAPHCHIHSCWSFVFRNIKHQMNQCKHVAQLWSYGQNHFTMIQDCEHHTFPMWTSCNRCHVSKSRKLKPSWCSLSQAKYWCCTGKMSKHAIVSAPYSRRRTQTIRHRQLQHFAQTQWSTNSPRTYVQEPWARFATCPTLNS